MKLFTFIILLIQIFVSCVGSTKANRKVENNNVEDFQPNMLGDVEQLKKAYQKLSSLPKRTKYQQEYFEAFPNSFSSFNKMFGYADKEPLEEPILDFGSPLTPQSENYVRAFFSLNSIDKTIYYNRIIDLSVNGRWYADAVNYFQHGLHEKVEGDIYFFCDLLSKRSENEIKSFWFFYFDSPHPIAELPKELKVIKQVDSKNFSLIESSLKEVQRVRK